MIRKNNLFVVVLLILIISTAAYAYTGSAHVYLGQFNQTASSLSYWFDSSVDTYGYKSHFRHANSNWDVLSAKVGLYETTNSSASIKIYVGYGNLDIDVLGKTDFWVGITEVSPAYPTNSNFDRARVRLDQYNITKMGYTNWGHKVKVSAHEIGHALSLGDFDIYPADSDTASWMYRQKTETQYPTATDKNHLVYKWGE